MDPRAYREHASVEQEHWWFAARRRMVEAVGRGLSLPGGARILELGAGTGGNLAMLSTLGDVVAIEPNDAAREISQERSPNVTHLARLDELTGGFAFDAVFALDVLEHIADAPDALRKVSGWMAPRAPIVVTVPAHAWLFGKHDVFLHHERRYSAETLRAHLTRGGMNVDFIRPMFAPLLPIAVTMRAVEAAMSHLRASPSSSRGMRVPPWPLNSFLREGLSLERLAPPRRVPFGLSLLAVARRSELG